MLVFTYEGYIQVILIPCSFTSDLRDLENPSSPNFDAEYRVRTGTPRRPDIEFKFTIDPDFCFIMYGRTALVRAMGDRVLTSII